MPNHLEPAYYYGPQNMSFFDTYQRHVESLTSDFKSINRQTRRVPQRACNLWASYAKQRFKAHQGFIDRYDLLDEVMGVTAVPLMALCMEGYFLGSAIYKTASCLTMNLGNNLNEETDSLTEALWDLSVVGVALAFSSYIFIKSCLSLVTRPIMTLLYGFQVPTEARFELDDDEVQALEQSLG